jgi:hypothetical protein
VQELGAYKEQARKLDLDKVLIILRIEALNSHDLGFQFFRKEQRNKNAS